MLSYARILPTPITHRLMMVIHETKANIVDEAINNSELPVVVV